MIYYSSDNIWIIGRQQDKEGTEVKGYRFIINAEKSRFIREKSKIPIGVSWEGGVEKYSGLLEIACEGGFVHKGKKGKSLGYRHMDIDTGEVFEDEAFYEKETMNAKFWDRYLNSPKFKTYIENRFKMSDLEKQEQADGTEPEPEEEDINEHD